MVRLRVLARLLPTVVVLQQPIGADEQGVGQAVFTVVPRRALVVRAGAGAVDHVVLRAGFRLRVHRGGARVAQAHVAGNDELLGQGDAAVGVGQVQAR